MALGYSTALRHAQLEQIEVQTDAHASLAGVLRLLSGTRPATGGAQTTVLATLTFADPSYLAAGAGVAGRIDANSIVQDSSADATGDATWFRVVQGDGTTHVMDGNVGTSGSDLNLNSISITTGGTVSVTSWQVTAGNP